MSDDDSLKARIAQHPKVLGILFTLFVLLSQAGAVAAEADSVVVTGP